jgi:hypothetical protein
VDLIGAVVVAAKEEGRPESNVEQSPAEKKALPHGELPALARIKANGDNIACGA